MSIPENPVYVHWRDGSHPCAEKQTEILEKNRKKVQITERNLEKYLGKSIYETTMKAEHDEVGIVRGLAWTSVGGDTLEIEVNLYAG